MLFLQLLGPLQIPPPLSGQHSVFLPSNFGTLVLFSQGVGVCCGLILCPLHSRVFIRNLGLPVRGRGGGDWVWAQGILVVGGTMGLWDAILGVMNAQGSERQAMTVTAARGPPGAFDPAAMTRQVQCSDEEREAKHLRALDAVRHAHVRTALRS